MNYTFSECLFIFQSKVWQIVRSFKTEISWNPSTNLDVCSNIIYKVVKSEARDLRDSEMLEIVLMRDWSVNVIT